MQNYSSNGQNGSNGKGRLNTPKPIRYGIVGLGKMGSLHLETMKKLAGLVEVTALSDISFKRLRNAQSQFPDAYATFDYRNLIGRVDAISICTPTEAHSEVATFFLKNKIPALVEKPIATTVHEAENMYLVSHENKTHLHIGHIERFNPTMIKARELISRPIFIETVRFGPYDDRVANIGVILDVMIHDLDLILWLLSGLDITLESAEAQGISILTPHEDVVKVRLKFRERNLKHLIVVDLNASRLSFEKIRKIRIFQEDSYLTINLLKKKLHQFTAKTMPPKSLDDIKVVGPKLTKSDPLCLELEHFINSIKNNRHDIHPREAWDALDLAFELMKIMEKKDIRTQPAACLANTKT
ncbi:Gfo/Idh/MocA family oxidoreductase [Elusimicrobiota bacterium]